MSWKERNSSTIPNISKINSDLVLRYLGDMEKGINVAHLSKKGGRSYVRLNTIKNRIVLIVKHFEARFGLDEITKVTEEQVLVFIQRIEKRNLVLYDLANSLSIWSIL